MWANHVRSFFQSYRSRLFFTFSAPVKFRLRLRLWLQLLLRLLLQITVVLIKMKFVLIEKNFIVVTARSEKNPGIYSKCTVHCVHCHWDFNKCFNPSQTLFWKKTGLPEPPRAWFLGGARACAVIFTGT